MGFSLLCLKRNVVVINCQTLYNDVVCGWSHKYNWGHKYKLNFPINILVQNLGVQCRDSARILNVVGEPIRYCYLLILSNKKYTKSILTSELFGRNQIIYKNT